MSNLYADLDVYLYRNKWPKIFILFLPFIYLTTWPTLCYRYQNWVFLKIKTPALRQLLSLIGFIFKNIVIICTGVTISERAIIGKGFYIAHLGNIVISHHTKIGNYCSMHQGVTCGGAGRGGNYGGPNIGNRVYIAAGAKIIGKINISDDAMIGANAVVVKNVLEKETVGGVPAKHINFEGSEGWVHYRGQN